MLRNQARIEIFNQNAGGWVREGLTPSENKILDIITDELELRKSLREPIISEYIKQLGLRVKSKKYGVISIRKISLQEKKNILDSARKVFTKHFRKSTSVGHFVIRRTPKPGTTRLPMLPILIE